MGFLKRKHVPDELPDLAVEGTMRGQREQKPILGRQIPSSEVPLREQNLIPPLKKEVAGEHYLEFPNTPSPPSKDLLSAFPELTSSEMSSSSFFNQVLEDINGEVSDLGKLEDWYKNKFLPQDVVSNMRSYWEENKAGMIIKSFGSEYKQKINEKIKKLQALEEDWRTIYFQLIKKEEDMKREERELKETLSEFVDLCRRRGGIPHEKEKSETTPTE